MESRMENFMAYHAKIGAASLNVYAGGAARHITPSWVALLVLHFHDLHPSM